MVVVIARTTDGERTQLLVAPITHSRPEAGEGVEIPPPVKRHLGLDKDRSWIIATELNRFIWPGPDVRVVPTGETPYYGEIPAKLFEELRTTILRNRDGKKVRIPTRTE